MWIKILVATAALLTITCLVLAGNDKALRRNRYEWIPFASPIGIDNRKIIVLLRSERPNEIVRFQTKVKVPTKPRPTGSLFIWPGIEPGGTLQHGVLQPALTFGPSCAPGNKPPGFTAWWISGQYVNLDYFNPSLASCSGGPVMIVEPGEVLTIDIRRENQMWVQQIGDLNNGGWVSFSINLRGEKQNYAFFAVEEFGTEPASEVMFFDSTITFGQPDRNNCRLSISQADASGLKVLDNGKACFIKEIVFR